MDDDLDAFFDDVDNAVKEVQETGEDDNDTQDVSTNTKTAAAAEDSPTATATAAADKHGDTEEQYDRPAKRTKVVAACSVPVKSVVASSVPVISIAPPLPAGPPPSASASFYYSNGSANATAISSHNIPPPPPPPNAPPLPNTTNPPPPPPQSQPTINSNSNNSIVNGNGKVHIRSAAGTTWSDPTLAQWPPNDFRLFIGNLPRDLKEHDLSTAFQKYPSFAMARIMYNKLDGKSRGYGFVSVLDAKDCARAIREMDQSWLGSRPIKVKLSEWKDREWKEVKKKGRIDK